MPKIYRSLITFGEFGACSMRNLFQMLANAADGAFVVNKNQCIIFWNQAAQKILGYPSNKVVGRPCYEMLRGCNDKGQAVCYHNCRVMYAALSGNPVPDFDVVVCTQSNHMRWVNVSVLTRPPARDETSPLIVHLFRDATDIKQHQQLVTEIFNAALEHASLPEHQPEPPAQPPHKSQLTRRELQVLTRLSQGFSTTEISEQLSISPTTVRNYIQSVLYSFQVHSRLEAVIYAQKHKIIQ
jgi:PAS domain S-box-containing protein